MDTIEKRIRDALQPIVPVVVANVYTGSALTYIVFNYDEVGAVLAEGTADTAVCSMQVHLFMPLNENPRQLKRQIRQALNQVGTFPAIINASDSMSQHYVFEFDALEAT